MKSLNKQAEILSNIIDERANKSLQNISLSNTSNDTCLYPVVIMSVATDNSTVTVRLATGTNEFTVKNSKGLTVNVGDFKYVMARGRKYINQSNSYLYGSFTGN